MQNEIKSIVFIGSGNVATNLACSYYSKGLKILQIISRNISNAELLAKCVKADFTDQLSEINTTADLVIISVNDSSVQLIAESLQLKGNLVVHTSGFLGMNILQNTSERYGVLYPLQSFIKARMIELRDVPFCIESENPSDLELLEQFARKVSSTIRYIDSQKRIQLHLAAVFACNFSNYMYSIAETILTKYHLSFDLLKPLIVETAQRTGTISPSAMQTGPARRNDTQTINEHLKMIDEEEFREIYALISKHIIKKYHAND